MARNGHPRVPRKIRGERRKRQRQLTEGFREFGVTWPRKPQPPKIKVRKYGNVASAVTAQVYDPLVRAALGRESDWAAFMRSVNEGRA